MTGAVPLSSLRSLGKPEALVTEVELRVICAEEDMAEDPKRAGRRRDVQADEARNALRLARRGDLQNVLLWRQDVPGQAPSTLIVTFETTDRAQRRWLSVTQGNLQRLERTARRRW